MANLDDTDPFADDVPSLPEADPDELTVEEKKRAIAAWNSGEKNLKAIIQASVGSDIDGRSKKGIAVKKYLGSVNIKPVPAQEYQKKGDAFVLTDAHKDYIRAHAGNNRPLELARELFNAPGLTNLATEARAVQDFYNTLDPSLRFSKDLPTDSSGYKPPKTHAQAIARVNRYVFDGIDCNKITSREEQMMNALIKFTHVHRFVYTMNEFNSARDRELFESSFVRFIYDKPDLTEEEVDLYMNICSDIVNYTKMQRDLDILIETRDNIMSADQKVPIAIVESIGKTYSEMDSNLKRQKVTLESLNMKRADRIKNRIRENASVVQLVDLWKKKVKRDQLIQVAEVRKEKLKGEIEKLESLDDLRFQLWGFGRQEAIDY